MALAAPLNSTKKIRKTSKAEAKGIAVQKETTNSLGKDCSKQKLLK
jgi:hypothetical protein